MQGTFRKGTEGKEQFLTLPMMVEAIAAVMEGGDFQTYLPLYGEDPWSFHTLVYLLLPSLLVVSSLAGGAALLKLTVSTWGRSFDPPRKPWALLLLSVGVSHSL